MNENKEDGAALTESKCSPVGVERIVSCEDDLFDGIDTADNVIKVPDDEKVFCEDPGCDWKGILSDCETEMDSEGWEYPEYEVLVCPKCGAYSVSF